MAENPDQSQTDPRQHTLFAAANPESNTAGMEMARDVTITLLVVGEVL